ncbi:MAG: ATP-binding cassette domain-containing protein [Anaerolineales bacterium]
MDFAIETHDLSRVYKLRSARRDEPRELQALKRINLEVSPGEVFGLLGPNGAGKTTLIKILTTLLAPSSGIARVAGFDVDKEPEQVRRRINMVSGGEASGYGLLTVRENLWMFAQFYGIPTRLANQRIDELLEVVGLRDRKNTKSNELSTGLRQKMNIVRGFLTDPDVLFLDEPTLGLDVGASREVRNYVRQWVDEDNTRTLLLTTHYMVEADELCDRVAIINQGQVLACDSPARLKQRLQKDVIFRLEVSPLNGLETEELASLAGVRKVTRRQQAGGTSLQFLLQDDSVISTVVTTLTAYQVQILNLEKREPTLEDVFVDLVGRSMEEVESASQSD